jgi:hypothetical protein
LDRIALARADHPDGGQHDEGEGEGGGAGLTMRRISKPGSDIPHHMPHSQQI